MIVQGFKVRALSRNHIERFAAQYVAVAADADTWTAENFLTELPGKWDLSFALWDKAPIAYAILSRPEPGRVHLHHFMVTEALRNQGLGGEMLKEVVKRAGQLRLTLKVDQANDGAQRFYEQHGFQLVEKGKYFLFEYRRPTEA
jgi:ribosomal protein S18 acetylase RimI-like enzyme